MLLFFSLLQCTLSIIVKDLDMELEPYQYNNIVWFGFQPGGKISLRIELAIQDKQVHPTEIISFYLCTPDDYKSLGDLNDKCKLIHYQKKGRNWMSYRKSIEEYKTYEFVLFSDFNETIHFKVSYEITNPGGEQLSTGVLELKYMMPGFIIAWGLLIIIWGLEWICTKRKKPTLVQALIIVNCVIWCLSTSIFNYYLYDFSEKGKSNPKLLTATRCVMYVCLISLFVLLELISDSISITKSSFSKATVLKLLGITLVYLTWCLLFELHHGGYIYYLLSGIYLLFMVLYMKDLRRILKELEAEMEKMIDENKDVIDSSIWHQVRMFRMYSISLLIFLAALACISGLYTYYRYIPWIGIGTQIYVIFIWILLLSLYFRFRISSPYSWADTNKT